MKKYIKKLLILIAFIAITICIGDCLAVHLFTPIGPIDYQSAGAPTLRRAPRLGQTHSVTISIP